MTQRVQILDETPGDGGRLGRHIEHDEASKGFAMELPETVTIQSVIWPRRVPVFDQGDTGSCTGNGTAGCIATDSLNRKGSVEVTGIAWKGSGPDVNALGTVAVDENLASAIYSYATAIDPFPGQFPPDDTGSSGNSAAKSAKRQGLITGYKWAFSMTGLLRALMLGPVMVGVAWTQGFDNVNTKTGLVHLGGQVRGGHEFEILGYDYAKRELIAAQSWGQDWTRYVPAGCEGSGGYFRIPADDMATLLANQGDCTIPVL